MMKEPLSGYPAEREDSPRRFPGGILGWSLGALLLAVPGAMAAGPRLVEDFETDRGTARWSFSEGREFPGAHGGFERAAEAAHGGKFGGQLRFDFSGGGRYVAA